MQLRSRASAVCIVLAAIARTADSGIIAASSLQMCETREDEESGETAQSCEEKMVVSLTLQNMQEESDSIRSIPASSCVGATDIGGVATCGEGQTLKDGQCCSGAEDQALAHPLIITAAKSRVRLRYPVTYSHMTFNDDPYEIFLCGPGNDEHVPEDGETPRICSELPQTFGVGPFTSNPCVDGSAEPEPSCGWRFPSSFSTAGTTWETRRNSKLKDSQGFCCECSVGDFLGVGEETESRAGLLCDALNTGQAHATAHCMRLGGLWYDAYNVEAAQTHFEIDVRFRQCADAACTDYTDTILTVGPSNPEARDPVSGSTVSFVGEWGPTEDNPSFEHQYLLRPLCLDPLGDPACATKQRAEIEHTSRWMLLDKTRFTLSGLECNKIGVGYSAFRNQPEKCEQPLGSCLDGIYSNSFLMSSAKIKDYYDEDLRREQAGQVPLYFVGSQMASSDFMMSEDLASRESWGGGATFLEWEIDRFQQSLITVVLKGGMISYERNIATGSFGPIEINTFESGQEGRVRVTVNNTGANLEGQFMVSIKTCQNSTRPADTCRSDSDCHPGVACTNPSGGDCDEVHPVCTCNIINSILDPFQARPTRTLGPGETDEIVFSVRSSVPLGATYCCNATLNSAYEIMDVKQFCFETTNMIRNMVGGDSCDPTVEDCSGMDGMGGGGCAQVCPSSIDLPCIMSHTDTCLGHIFWIVIWVVIIILVACVANRLGLFSLICGGNKKK